MWACSEVSGNESARRRKSLEVIGKAQLVDGAMKAREGVGKKGLDRRLAILYILYIQKLVTKQK